MGIPKRRQKFLRIMKFPQIAAVLASVIPFATAIGVKRPGICQYLWHPVLGHICTKPVVGGLSSGATVCEAHDHERNYMFVICDICDAKFYKKDEAAHNDTCIVICDFCDAKFYKKDEAAHNDTCSEIESYRRGRADQLRNRPQKLREAQPAPALVRPDRTGRYKLVDRRRLCDST